MPSGSGSSGVVLAVTAPVFPRQLRVEPWVDPAIDRVGFPAASPYVEALWVSAIGPTAAWAFRRLAAVVAVRPEGTSVDLGVLGVSLGVGSNVSRHSTVSRAIGRLVSFRLASCDGEVLRVRQTVPPLSRRQLSRLTPSLLAVHERMVSIGGRDGVGMA